MMVLITGVGFWLLRMRLVAFGGSFRVVPGPGTFSARRQVWLKVGGLLLVRLFKGLGIRRRLLSIPS